MKSTLLLSFLCLCMLGCQQDEPNTPQVQATAEEQAISGDWIHDSTNTYYNGVIVPTSCFSYNDPDFCHVDLQIAPHSVQPTNGHYLNCVLGLACQPTVTFWYIQNGDLYIANTQHKIVTQTTNSLVIQRGSISTSGGSAIQYYLHR